MPFLLDRLNWFNIAIFDLFDISVTIPSLVAALGGILPPGCGTLSPARRLTRVVDQCLSESVPVNFDTTSEVANSLMKGSVAGPGCW